MQCSTAAALSLHFSVLPPAILALKMSSAASNLAMIIQAYAYTLRLQAHNKFSIAQPKGEVEEIPPGNLMQQLITTTNTIF
jgi:hypothetical protein